MSQAPTQLVAEEVPTPAPVAPTLPERARWAIALHGEGLGAPGSRDGGVVDEAAERGAQRRARSGARQRPDPCRASAPLRPVGRRKNTPPPESEVRPGRVGSRDWGRRRPAPRRVAAPISSARGRRQRLVALGVLVVAVLAPPALWHGLLVNLASSLQGGATYAVCQMAPWLLMAGGIVFLIPVAMSEGRSPESRLYPRSRNAYLAWGTVLYLLGCLMAVEVAELATV